METQRFTSVWVAIEDTPQDAANMKARSELMLAIRDVVDGWDLSQAKAAARIGVTQPRMTDLLRGRIDRFSLDALLNLAHAAGLFEAWSITRVAARHLKGAPSSAQTALRACYCCVCVG